MLAPVGRDVLQIPLQPWKGAAGGRRGAFSKDEAGEASSDFPGRQEAGWPGGTGRSGWFRHREAGKFSQRPECSGGIRAKDKTSGKEGGKAWPCMTEREVGQAMRGTGGGQGRRGEAGGWRRAKG